METVIDHTTQYLTRPEGRIAYDVAGEGPLVIAAPGMGDLRSVYRFLAPALVDAGYRVATMDLRGHGDSDMASTPSFRATFRIVTDATPRLSARATAARTTRSRERGERRPFLDSVRFATRQPPGRRVLTAFALTS